MPASPTLLVALLGCVAAPGPKESAPGDPSASDSATTRTGADSTDSVPTGSDESGTTTTVETGVAPSAAPTLETGDASTLPVATAAGLPEVVGFSVNARVHPHGLPTTWTVEYGATDGYGSTAESRALPGRLDAWYREEWDSGVNGYAGGIGGAQLSHEAAGGPDGTGFVRYTDNGTLGDDTNHYDGIGIIHLALYSYIGHFDAGTAPPLYLGGGFPDLRGAKLAMYLRGNDWDPHGTELGTWIQGYRDVSVVTLVPEDSRYPNWAFTGDPLTSHASSGLWELAEWTLRNRTQDWTFAGCNGGRLVYDYGELDGQLSHVNVDFFPIQILYVDLYDQPSGSLDYDQLSINFRQHSVTAPANGGTLVGRPGGTGAELLADGWRNGAGREWRSDPNPVDPQVFEYAFADLITLNSVTVHNAATYPSEGVALSVSEDGGATWTELATGNLPDGSEAGPNFSFWHLDRWVLADGIAVWAPLHPNPVNRLRVTISSGYQPEAWGLGEIEAFGTGAVETTDDDWYDVNQDVYVERGTWHYRVIAANAEGTAVGPDQVVEVP